MSGDQWIFPLHTLWAHELRALLGPSQRALECTMEHKTAESVALATFLPRKLFFSTRKLVNRAPLDHQELPEVPLARGLSISISSRP